MQKDDTHNNHRKRMRKKFLETGANGFYEHEFLEMILFYAIPRINTNPHAHRLIKHFGSLEKVLAADPHELMEVDGIGASSSCLISALAEAARRYLNSSEFQLKFTSKDEIKSFLIEKTKNITCDTCLIISVSAQLELTGISSLPLEKLLFSKNSSREFIENVIKGGADRIIVGLCRPNSLPMPTQSDFTLTRTMAEALDSIKAELIDVFICGRGNAFSMRSSGSFSFKEI